jgi:hypothetical protein
LIRIDMRNRKLIIIIVAAIAIAVGAYFGIAHLRNRMPSLNEGFGILQSEVEFRNVYPGWSGSAPLTIINGRDQDRTFSVSLEQPNPTKLKDGYEAFPQQYYSWITISEKDVTIKAGQYHEEIIIFAMPEDADYAGKQAEIRIRVSDMTPQGLVTLAVESRWYIITAEQSSL